MLEWQGARYANHGIVLEQTRPPQSLMYYVVGNHTVALDFDDLVRMARRLELLDVGSQSSRHELAFVKTVQEAASKPNAASLLAQDPFVEKVLGEAEEEDKKEFQSVDDAIKAQRAKRRFADLAWKHLETT